MPARYTLIVSSLVVGTCLGCSEEPRGVPRLETFPVQGKVLVDGQPAERLQVKLTPTENQQIVYELVGYTDAEGVFTIGTYEAGDGVPAGEYTVTFEWIQGTGMMDRHDALKGRYTSVEESEWSVRVTQGEPIDLGTIELTTVDDEPS